MKKVVAIIVFAVVFFSSCNGKKVVEMGQGVENAVGNVIDTINGNKIVPDVTIDKLSLTADEGIVDGQRYVLFEYVNNSEYVITYFKINFKEKSGLKSEDKNAFFEEMKELFGNGDEKEDAEAFDEFKKTKIAMRVEFERLAKVGESVRNERGYYYQGYYYIRSADHLDMVEPDIATFSYIKDGKIYTAHYDYISEKYTIDEETEDAFYWSDSSLGEMIPVPDSEYVKLQNSDDDKRFSFEVYGVTKDEFRSYIAECKAKGFNTDIYNSSDFEVFSAKNENGYSVRFSYDGEKQMFDGAVEAPEKE